MGAPGFTIENVGIPQWRALGDGLYAAGQPGPNDWPALRRAGLLNVLNLRPSDEQPGMDERALVTEEGMDYACLPVGNGADLGREVVSHFDDLLRGLARPLLVHCASANRVGALFALRAAWLEGTDAGSALALGRTAGLTSLEPRVRELLGVATD
jgi:uncharacterized protein (TIGR01244 family)